jgi:hypothetical protein
MPTYDVDIPGQGSFSVDSDRELTDDEAIAAVSGSEFNKGGTYAKYYGGEGGKNALGRRFGENIDAALDLPSAVGDVFTGGRDGRLDAALRILKGIGSPFSMATAPIEAVGEELTTGLTGSEKAGRLVGDLSGIGATFGVGALAKAGKLGPTTASLARMMGVGVPRTFEEMLVKDPQMRFVAERGFQEIRSSIEQAARNPGTMAEVALELNRPAMSQAALQRARNATDGWTEAAKANNIISEIPESPQLDKLNVIFDGGNTKDINLFQTLGTPATRAAAIDKRAGQAAYMTNLTDMEIIRAINNREARTAQAFAGVGDEDIRKAVITRMVMNHDEAMALPEEKLSQGVKNVMQYLEDKFNVDRKIAIPRLRDNIRGRLARQVEKDLEGMSDAAKVAELERRVQKAVPDNLKIDDAVLELFPGFYQIKDAKGQLIDTANTALEWKNKVFERAKATGMKAEEFKIEAKAFFDADLLHMFKGRIERAYNHIGNSLAPNTAEIASAIKGEFSLNKPFQLLKTFKGESSASGYGKDLQTLLNTYDRSFERWMQVSDLKQNIRPILNEIRGRYPTLALELEQNMNTLWGHRMPGGALVDNVIAATPLLRDVIAPNFLERFVGGTKNAVVNLLLRYNPRFRAVNSTQTFATLWPIADAEEIIQGAKLVRETAGQAILDRHGISDLTSKIPGMIGKGMGLEEKFNQQTAFMTMYNRARKFGLTDMQAADYGKLRGNIYSQFMGLTTDQPIAFRKIDPTGLMFMFQRFPVKQVEQVIDLMKDRNFPGAAKWLGVQLALGGFKAATMGQTGWLTYKMYKDIEEKYGKGVADVFHTGLPSMAGVDVSNSMMLVNPPFGATWAEKLGNTVLGPVGGITTSILGTALNTASPTPEMGKRAYDAFVAKIPMAKELNTLVKLWEGDYDFKDPSGRLQFKGEFKDLAKRFLGFRTGGGTMGVTTGPNQMREAELDTFADALMELRQKRDGVLDYAASRYGQASLAGIDLGDDMRKAVQKEVDNWNRMWPESPITGDDIMKRAKSRRDVAMKTLGERLLKNAPKAIRESAAFAPSPQDTMPGTGLPYEFADPNGGG